MAEKKKGTKEDLRKLHVYTRGLIEASPDMMFTFDSDGVIMDVNKQAIDVTGVAREKLIGSPFKQYLCYCPRYFKTEDD
jgi:PAS domain S-box-containing protein